MAKKKNSMRKIVQDVDKMFDDWNNSKKDPHSKLPETAPPENFVDFGYKLGTGSHVEKAVEEMRKVITATIPYHQPDDVNVTTKWDDSLRLYIVTAANFRISIDELQFDYTGGLGYFTVTNKDVPIVNQMMQRDEPFVIMQSSGANGSTVAGSCKVNHMSSETTSTTTFKFFSMSPRDFHAFNKYRQPLFKNDTSDTIHAGDPVKPHGSGIASYVPMIDKGFIPTPRMWDRQWAGDDLTEKVPEIACRICEKPTRELVVGGEFIRTCDTPGCPNNINFKPEVIAELPVEDLEKVIKAVHMVKMNAPKFIMSVFSAIIFIITIAIMLSQVMK